MAINLNLIFIINVGLLINYSMLYFKLTPPFDSRFLNLLIYCIIVFFFFNSKTIVCKILGILFKFQEEFQEYSHNENLFNKNVGLLLFPIIILFPYVPENSKEFVLFAGLFFFGIMVLLRIFRGMQIIIRKGVSPFYMILYLCAIEILPVLLLVKYSITLI